MRVSTFYFLFFATVGVVLPYLWPYLKGLDLTGRQIGLLAAIGPSVMVVLPPLWGWLADRTRRVTAVLKVAMVGSTLAFAPLLGVQSFVAVGLVLAAHAIFHAPITALADTVAVAEARRLGTEYARLRLWGSVGFVVATFAFGLHLDRGGDDRDVLYVALALLAAASVFVLALRPVAATPAVPSLADARRLAGDGGLMLFLLACAVHWAAASPYHVFFAVHLDDLGIPPRFVGLGLAGAVTAEVAVMWRFHRLRRRASLYALLMIAFFVSALRWALTAAGEGGPMLAAVQLLHGLTFGIFFVASIAHLEDAVPEHLRATGRTLFASVVFGLGGLCGNALAGLLYDLGGGALAFGFSAGLQLVAPLLLWIGARRSGVWTAPTRS